MKCHAGVEFPNGAPCPKCHAKLGEVCWPGINAELLELARLRAASSWQPIETAPRDRTPVLLKFKDRIPNEREDLRRWDGIVFVGRNYGDPDDWGFAAPVGMGGFPDDWFAGWRLADSAAPGAQIMQADRVPHE